MSEKYITLSDLHLFCTRSVGEARVAEIERNLDGITGIILNGDIFDFRWSTLPSTQATADAAVAWLEALAQSHPDCKVHYILGNHDYNQALLSQLPALAERNSNLDFHHYHLRLGNTLFLHGEPAMRPMTHADLENYRARWLDEERMGTWVNALYEIGFSLGIHKAIHRMVSPEARVCTNLNSYIEQLAPELSQGLRNIYFGHTHVPVYGVEYNGLHFFNCGGALRGLSFQPFLVEPHLHT